jgi:putative tryptophan/tyrosine transport system substrate-binding protein
MFEMRRREFIALMGGTASAWPLAARAQQAAMPVVGFVSTAGPNTNPQFVKAFRDGLASHDFVEGQNVAIEYRWAEGHLERLPSMITELIRRQVSVIVATGGDVPALIAKGATATIPIVFLTAADPIKSGLVASLNRPDRNAIGATLLGGALGAKRLELLNAVVPKGSIIGMLVNGNNPNSEPETLEVQTAANALGRKVHVIQANSPQEIDGAFASLTQIGAGGVLVNPDPGFMIQRDRIIALAARLGKPAIYYSREYPDGGGLMSYGASFGALYYQGGDYAARILKGAKPAELPVVQPTRFQFVINLKTAKSLGLDVPAELLALADETIE